MKNMFYNYDHNINKKEYPVEEPFFDDSRKLVCDNDTYIIGDIKGNEIGVQVQKNSEFTLYFSMLADCSASDISEADITFRILDHAHREIIPGYEDYECLGTDETIEDKHREDNIQYDYNAETNTVIITVPESEAARLKAETYNMELKMKLNNKTYTLFSEDSGKLIVR